MYFVLTLQKLAESLEVINESAIVDCTDPISAMEACKTHLNTEVQNFEDSNLPKFQGADIVINCLSVKNSERVSLLLSKNNGIVYFHSLFTTLPSGVLTTNPGCGTNLNLSISNCSTEAIVLVSLSIYPTQVDDAISIVEENPLLKKYLFQINSETIPVQNNELEVELWRPSPSRATETSLFRFAKYLEKKKVLKLRQLPTFSFQ